MKYEIEIISNSMQKKWKEWKQIRDRMRKNKYIIRDIKVEQKY